MPTAVEIVFAPEDEKLFFEFMARFHLTAYPQRIPPGFKPIPVRPDSQPLFTEEDYYLASEEIAPPALRPIKKGKDRGYQQIDETACPVIFYGRCIFDENNELRSGKLWTELNLNGDMQLNTNIFPEAYRRMWIQMREHIVARCRKSDPAGFYIGGQAAREARAGTMLLRETGRKGGPIKPYR